MTRIANQSFLGAGVTKTCRYEPDLTPTYAALAEHYQAAVIPARVRKAKDKSKVEVGVQIVQRSILAALRHRTFFSLAEANGYHPCLSASSHHFPQRLSF